MSERQPISLKQKAIQAVGIAALGTVGTFGAPIVVEKFTGKIFTPKVEASDGQCVGEVRQTTKSYTEVGGDPNNYNPGIDKDNGVLGGVKVEYDQNGRVIGSGTTDSEGGVVTRITAQCSADGKTITVEEVATIGRARVAGGITLNNNSWKEFTTYINAAKINPAPTPTSVPPTPTSGKVEVGGNVNATVSGKVDTTVSGGVNVNSNNSGSVGIYGAEDRPPIKFGFGIDPWYLAGGAAVFLAGLWGAGFLAGRGRGNTTETIVADPNAPRRRWPWNRKASYVQQNPVQPAGPVREVDENGDVHIFDCQPTEFILRKQTITKTGGELEIGCKPEARVVEGSASRTSTPAAAAPAKTSRGTMVEVIKGINDLKSGQSKIEAGQDDIKKKQDDMNRRLGDVENKIK